MAWLLIWPAAGWAAALIVYATAKRINDISYTKAVFQHSLFAATLLGPTVLDALFFLRPWAKDDDGLGWSTCRHFGRCWTFWRSDHRHD